MTLPREVLVALLGGILIGLALSRFWTHPTVEPGWYDRETRGAQ